MQQGLRAVLAICVVGAIGVATGCGGGGDDSASVTRTIAGRTITTPLPSSTTSTSDSGPARTGTAPETYTLPGGDTVSASDLAPFRACLRRHGVQPLALDSAQSDFKRPTPAELAKLRSQLEQQLPARTACAPELPPDLQEIFERFKERLQGAGAR